MYWLFLGQISDERKHPVGIVSDLACSQIQTILWKALVKSFVTCSSLMERHALRMVYIT